MSKRLLHEPKVITDNEAEVYYVKCSICGKVLWYPEPDDRCKEPDPPPLGIHIIEGIGAVDKFGG